MWYNVLQRRFFIMTWENSTVKKILFTEEEIIERSKELGAIVTEAYKDNPPLVVALLRGSVPFLAELIKHIDLNIEYDFMDVSSYVGTESMGDIRILKDLDTSVKGKDILLVEDIVDTGATIKEVMGLLQSRGARSVRIITLLNKQGRRNCNVKADYIGFEIPDEFVVGYGLDFNQKYRSLPYVGVLKEECYTSKE